MKSPVSLIVAFALAAASPTVSASEETKTVVAGEKFRAGALHRLMFGADHRELWTTPVELPVLDLESYAGGLKVVRQLGHGQTKALALKGGDGRDYTFRPVLKDPAGLLPEELRDTVAANIIRDQMASQHPGGHVVVPPLLEAVGLLHNTPKLVVLPDSPALGEFRKEFGGQVGDLEEYVGQPGYGGSVETIKTEALYERLDAEPAPGVDAEAYLTARLVDHLIGDWDRHRGQWKWVRIPGKKGWQPIPEDRDQAFSRFEGLVVAFLRDGLPLLVKYGPDYPGLDSLMFDSWDIDRRLLTRLDAAAFEAVARRMQEALSDAVIDDAVAQLPEAYRKVDGPRLRPALRARRDGLVAQAQGFHRFLAEEVDVRASTGADVVEVEHGESSLLVRVRAADDETAYFERRFDAGDTDEVRLQLLGGGDRVTLKGKPGPIQVRVLCGKGVDTVDDRASGGAAVYDPEKTDVVQRGPGTTVSDRPYTPPTLTGRDAYYPPRDWGRRTIWPEPRISGSTDLGPVIRVGLQTTSYAFRRHPFASRHRLSAAFATLRTGVRLEEDGEVHFENHSSFLRLKAQASELEILHFYGFGNETDDSRGRSFHEVEQDRLTLAPSFVVPLGKRAEAWIGPTLQASTTDRPDGRFVTEAAPYGSEDFGQVGAAAGLRWDTRTPTGLPERGVHLRVAGSIHPAVWSVSDLFGAVEGDIAFYRSLGRPVQVVVRGGGKRVWGEYPFHEAAFLGGGGTVRGLPSQRYAGDASLYGGAELRVSLGPVFVLVPGELSLFALGDVGRVFLEGEDSDRWHEGVGGGLTFASPGRSNAVSLAVARSEGSFGVYLETGVSF